MNKAGLKRLGYQVLSPLVLRLGPLLSNASQKNIAIFAAHGIHTQEMLSRGKPPSSSMPFGDFAANVMVLQRFFNIISMDEAVEMMEGTRPWRKRCVVLTFDDSLQSMATVVAPWLAKRHLTATFFLSTDIIETRQPYWWLRLDYAVLHSSQRQVEITLSSGETFHLSSSQDSHQIRPLKRKLFWVTSQEREKVLGQIEQGLKIRIPENPEVYPHATPITWEEARELPRFGMTLGSHTVTHPNLARLSEDELNYELIESKRILEEQSQSNCHYLCYPHGLCSEATLAMARQSAYRAAVTTQSPGWNGCDQNRFSLNRFYLPRNPYKLAFLLNDRWWRSWAPMTF